MLILRVDVSFDTYHAIMLQFWFLILRLIITLDCSIEILGASLKLADNFGSLHPRHLLSGYRSFALFYTVWFISMKPLRTILPNTSWMQLVEFCNVELAYFLEKQGNKKFNNTWITQISNTYIGNSWLFHVSYVI